MSLIIQARPIDGKSIPREKLNMMRSRLQLYSRALTLFNEKDGSRTVGLTKKQRLLGDMIILDNVLKKNFFETLDQEAPLLELADDVASAMEYVDRNDRLLSGAYQKNDIIAIVTDSQRTVSKRFVSSFSKVPLDVLDFYRDRLIIVIL